MFVTSLLSKNMNRRIIVADKGKRYIKCPACRRKRYCSSSPAPNNCMKIICSKKHEWIIELPTTERIVAIMKVVLLDKVRGLFERDDTFYRSLK